MVCTPDQILFEWPNLIRVTKSYSSGQILFEWPNLIRVAKSYSSDQIKKSEMGGARGTYGGETDAWRVLVEKPKGNRSLEKT
jgi:hypothetical protein